MPLAELQWNLFNGGQDKARIQQAKMDQARLQAKLVEVSKQVMLDVRRAYEDVRVVQRSLVSSRKELLAAEKNFEIVRKEWQQGMALEIVFLDAQQTYMQAEMNNIVATSDYFIQQARLERAAASLPLNVLFDNTD